jgi:membrane associated rhomboid family serine protease
VATRVLSFSMLVVAVAITIFLGSSTDIGVLVRDGALVRGLVRDGERWRVIACVFVHIGGLHLLVNTFGLWMLGRLVEELFGASRTVAIFAVAGIAGALASLFAVPAGISAGASGALFGMLGAVFIELTLYRRHHRMMWTRGVWGSIAVVTVAQLAIGFFYPVTDQWAHGGGLIAGALAGAVLSPHARWHAAGLHLARVLAIGFAAACAVTAVLVIRTSISDSLAQAPRVRRPVGTLSAVVPASWQRQKDELFDPDLNIVMLAQRVPASGTLNAQVDEFLAGEQKRAKAQQLEQVTAAPDPAVPLPPGWQGSELVGGIPDPLGDLQRFRVVVAGRSDGDTVVLARVYSTESIARAAPERITSVLASLQ